MSWDVVIMRVPHGATNVNDLIEGRVASPPLGSLALVRNTLRDLAPNVDLSEGDRAHIDIGDAGYLGITIGEEDPCTDLLCEVRGSDEAAVDLVAKLRTVSKRTS